MKHNSGYFSRPFGHLTEGEIASNPARRCLRILLLRSEHTLSQAQAPSAALLAFVRKMRTVACRTTVWPADLVPLYDEAASLGVTWRPDEHISYR